MSNLDENGSIKDPYENFIALSRYARWVEEKGRRETWSETVDRVVDFYEQDVFEKTGVKPTDKDLADVRAEIKAQNVMPSMRVAMTAGEALRRNNVAGFNCSALAVDNLRAFDETLLILMQGTGLGFSVSKKQVSKLPPVPKRIAPGNHKIIVEDSKEGWAQAFRGLISLLWAGIIPTFDTSNVRPAGARLKTFGGRASGPEPLLDLFAHTIKIVCGAKDRQITPLEAHSIMNKIAEIVVVGGVRRSALISLSDLEDEDMSKAKVGEWWKDNPHFALSNNSAIYYEKPTEEQFNKEWKNLAESGSGERGIFNLEAAQKKASSNGRRDGSTIVATNPCGEIFLRNGQFCNLSEVIVRDTDTLIELKRKVALATKIGTWQSTLTDIKHIRENWKRNTEEERLLGVSLTGQLGHPVLSKPGGDKEKIKWLKELKKTAIDTNKKEAERLGIPQSVAITTCKPSGTVSQLTSSASGMHAWHNDYYVRTVRGDNKDPITQFMKESGIPNEPCVMKPDSTTVFSFPRKAPDSALTRKDLTAIEHLEIWLDYQRHWCEHNPSVTISVKEEEWEEVGDWVWDHFDEVTGVSFLPFSDHTYQQAPYQDCTKEEYGSILEQIPQGIDWSDLSFYEVDDSNVSGSQSLSCVGDKGCESVDIV